MSDKTYWLHDHLVQCPACGEDITAQGTNIGVKLQPRPGDLTLCVYCLRWLKFDADLELQIVMPREMATISPEDQAEMAETRQRARVAFADSPARKRAQRRH